MSGLLIRFSRWLGLGMAIALTAQPLLMQPTVAQRPPAAAAERMAQRSASSQFQDVPATYWAASYITALAERGIVTGFPDGTFQPDAPVTRAQFAAMLQQAFPNRPISNPAGFVDVPSAYWGEAAVRSARGMGFLNGYPGNVFRPEQLIPRVQVLVSLANGLGYRPDRLTYLDTYVDQAAIPDYARAAIAAATQAQLVVNYPTPRQLNPNRNATRAEVAAMLYQALVQEHQVEPMASPYVVEAARARSPGWPTTPQTTIDLATPPRSLSLSATGDRLATLSPAGDLIQVWQTQTGALVTEIATDSETRIHAVTLSPSGRHLVAIVQTLPRNAVELWQWDLQSGRQQWRQPLGLASAPPGAASAFADVPVAHVLVQPGDRVILTQVSLGLAVNDRPVDTQLRLHDAVTGAVRQRLPLTAAGEPVTYQRFQFSSDGQYLAGMNTRRLQPQQIEQTVDVWRVATGDRVFSVPAATGQFGFVDFAFTSTNQLQVLSQHLYDARLLTVDAETAQVVVTDADIPAIDRQDRLGRLGAAGEVYLVRSDVAGTRIIHLPSQTVTELDVYVEEATFSPTGDLLAIATPDQVLIFARP